MRFPLRHDRWVFAAAAFVAGVVLAAAAIGAGVRVAIGGRDFTLVAALLLEAGLALAGFVIGRGVEARVAEEREQAVARRTLEEMSVLQARLADRQRLAAIGELGATVAHEIRNPLAIIRTMLHGREISLRVRDVGSPVRLLGDPDLLCQVVQNLADSASGTPDVRRTSEAGRRPHSLGARRHAGPQSDRRRGAGRRSHDAVSMDEAPRTRWSRRCVIVGSIG